MIVPMKKISLVVLDKHREESLKKLREIGVVHLSKKSVSSDALSKLLDRKAKMENALGILRPFDEKPKPAKKSSSPEDPKKAPHPRRRAADYVNSEGVPFSTEALNAPDRKDLILHILDKGEERKFLQERTTILSKEKTRIEGWGSFNPEDLKLLEQNGIVLHLYEIPNEAFQSLPADVPYFVTARDKINVRIAVPNREMPGGTPFQLGEYSLAEINSLLSDMKLQLADLDKQLASLSFRKVVIESELKTLLYQIEFETANSGMELLEGAPPIRVWSFLRAPRRSIPCPG